MGWQTSRYLTINSVIGIGSQEQNATDSVDEGASIRVFPAGCRKSWAALVLVCIGIRLRAARCTRYLCEVVTMQMLGDVLPLCISYATVLRNVPYISI
jgi:hypothetical protein